MPMEGREIRRPRVLLPIRLLQLPRLGDSRTLYHQLGMEKQVYSLANAHVYWMLVDIGCSVDILYRSTFKQMGLSLMDLKSCTTPIYRFNGDLIHPLRMIELPLIMGERPEQVTVMSTFILVDCPIAFNLVFVRTSLYNIKSIMSTYRLAMKFPTLGGVAMVKGEQKDARESYNTSLRIAAKPCESVAMTVCNKNTLLQRVDAELDPRVKEEVHPKLDEEIDEVVILKEDSAKP
uniref:Uncharacterized protein n=1 Tax=Cannabis sativa TaxID=3483 RepID=A0A803QI16_CANSA